MLYFLRKKRLKNSTSELHQLKSLLLNDELEQLKKLESKLQKLDFRTEDQESIIERITPLFDTILLQRLQEKDNQTIKILSDYLAEVITKSSQTNLDKLSLSLQSVIAPAISKEIANNKEVMIDSLYPIMGGMISKYVTQAIKEMMENINAKIESGLSFNKYKRKIKSKLTGVSETELLLEESSDAVISSLFTIQKESGLLISEAHLQNKGIDDAHMVASMASAIKDFVNDWIQNSEKNTEVQILSYGNATLYIESAGSVYIIAFLDAEPDHEQRAKINEFFGKLIKQYSAFFQHFDGDDSAKEIQLISQKMDDFLRAQNQIEKEETTVKKHYLLKGVGLLLGILFLVYVFFFFQQYYVNHKLESLIFEKTKETINIRRIDNKLTVSGNISSMDNYYAIKNIIKKETGETFVNTMHMPIEEVDKKLMTVYTKATRSEAKMSKQMALFSNKINQLEETVRELNYQYKSTENEINFLEKKTKQIRNITKMKKNIIQKLNQVFMHNDAYHPIDGSLNLKNKKLFSLGEASPRMESIESLKKNFTKYLNVLMEDIEIRPYIKHIVIEGYTDSKGSHLFNQKLSKERAEKIKTSLLKLPISIKYNLQNLLEAKGLANANPIIINGVEDAEASRRIQIRFELDNNKIINTIEKTIND